MALAGIGALTGLAEAAATAIGAGMLLGGFIAGSIGTARRRERMRRDQDVLAAGYLGGYIAAGLALVDLVARYAG
jgi:hypothetical protein